ncbi:MAG: ACT domain-containing protein, partial [Verrucomicrobiota bacterium]
MELTTQLALFLDNKPGSLARVCDALAEARVNIYAISTSDTVDHVVVRMVVSDPRKALHLFEERRALVVESEVIMIHGDNKPGSLARIARVLGDARINIEYAYCATSPNARNGLLVLRPSNPRKALRLLNEDGGPSQREDAHR